MKSVKMGPIRQRIQILEITENTKNHEEKKAIIDAQDINFPDKV